MPLKENSNTIPRANSTRNRILSIRARRAQPAHQDMIMDHATDSPESSPVSRNNDNLETALYPMQLYHDLIQTTTASASRNPFVATQDNSLGGVQVPPMADNAGNDAYGAPDFVPLPGGYLSIGYPFRRMDYLAMENGFGLPAQGIDDDYHLNDTAAAVHNPYSQDLQPGSHDTPTTAANLHVETNPDTSTVPEHVTTGYSSSPILPNYNDADSQEVGVVVWNSRDGAAPVSGNRRKRRKMTDDELVRGRALKAAGGACDGCRKRKKRCHHKDDQLILTAPAPTAASASASTPAPSQHTPVHVNNNLGTGTLQARPRPVDTNRRAVALSHQQQQRNPSITSSYGRSVDPSMFSPSEGGTSSNGTVTSTQSDATTFAGDEFNPVTRPEEQFGMDAAGFGQQFNGQLAQQFNPMNIMAANNDIDFDHNWLNAEHPGQNDNGDYE